MGSCGVEPGPGTAVFSRQFLVFGELPSTRGTPLCPRRDAENCFFPRRNTEGHGEHQRRIGFSLRSCAALRRSAVPLSSSIPRPRQTSTNLNRHTAFKGLQRNPKLAGRRVSPRFPDHRSSPPQAWCFAPLIHPGLWSGSWGPFHGAKLKDSSCRFLVVFLLLWMSRVH